MSKTANLFDVKSSSISMDAGRIAIVVFTAAIFTSAFLLFAIQPMFTKMILPQLGGSPGVWSVAMVFFQAMLLLGYLYAHLSTRYLSLRTAIMVHVSLLVFTFVALPISIFAGLGNPPAEGQMFWLMAVFALSVGLPFFAVAGNGPLLQAWFARSSHKNAHDPYFLYAASNLGSFSALILYPVLFEPTLRLGTQTQLWSAGFTLLAVLIIAAGFLVRKAGPAPVQNTIATGAAAEAPKLKTIANWVWLSFIPSGLLVAVTAHISTDIAAAPFLWVIPLALFLLTFVLVFRDRPLIPVKWIVISVPVLAGSMFLANLLHLNMVWTGLVHLGFFLAATLMCHQRLYGARPAAQHLTQFYLWMSFGGVLGGLFSGLLAPYIFSTIMEYPILVTLVMLVHPVIMTVTRKQMVQQSLPVVVIGLVLAGVMYVLRDQPVMTLGFMPVAVVGTGALSLIVAYNRPLIALPLIAGLFVASAMTLNPLHDTIYERSFFGVNKVALYQNGQYRVMMHGTTVHGAMRVKNPDGTPYTGPVVPLTYYHKDSSLAATLRLLPPNANGRDVGVVGLGPGAQACNGMAGDRWTYYEIDSVVVKLATDTSLFNFLSACAPKARIVLGDARLTLGEEAPRAFDYLLIDAFASDSIPVHLLTREAMQLYVTRLKPKGVLAMNITNRQLELESVVAAVAKSAGLYVKVNRRKPSDLDFSKPLPTTAVVLAQQPGTLDNYTADKGWVWAEDNGVTAWSDDYSNIPGAIWRKYKQDQAAAKGR